MSDNSNIEWTDATWNPVRGCVKVSPGCAHCYAETFAERFRGVPGHPYEQGFDLRMVPDKLAEPLSWKKPRRVFVNSMSDLFQDGVPDDYIGKVFDVMAQAWRHTFQVLTKRPERMRALVPTFAARHTAQDGSGWPLKNVWLGVSVENQHFADERIPFLLQTPAAVRFISAEPLLGPVNFRWAKWDDGAPHARRENQHPPVERAGKVLAGAVNHLDGLRMLDWVIVGGESGGGARTFDLAWARSIVAQCKAAGVACFVKQLGSRPVREAYNANAREELRSFGGRSDFIEPMALRSKKGGDPAEWPDDLRVREFPEVTNG